MASDRETGASSSLKLLLMSTGLISMVVVLKLTVPITADFCVYEAPMLWSNLVSCFTPPYLYLLINTIIISIVASSKLHTPSSECESPFTVPAVSNRSSEQDFPVGRAEFEIGYPMIIGPGEDAEARISGTAEEEEDEEFVISRSSWTPPLKESAFADKPPASARFSSRRSPKPKPEVSRGLGVAKPKRTETLESTWRTITDGRAMPLTRHLRKSETFNQGTTGAAESSPPIKAMQNSETFGCEKDSNLGSAGKLRREPSLSNDELNRKVEAFIKKFNDEMKRQRLESLHQYQRMIPR